MTGPGLLTRARALPSATHHYGCAEVDDFGVPRMNATAQFFPTQEDATAFAKLTALGYAVKAGRELRAAGELFE